MSSKEVRIVLNLLFLLYTEVYVGTHEMEPLEVERFLIQQHKGDSH